MFTVGCVRNNDHVEVYNLSHYVFDNVGVDVKEGYFYDRHEKNTVDENTISLTIYFKKMGDEEVWE
jgi:hypothetical protein